MSAFLENLEADGYHQENLDQETAEGEGVEYFENIEYLYGDDAFDEEASDTEYEDEDPYYQYWENKIEPIERGGEYTALHRAVEQDNFDQVLKELKGGAYTFINNLDGLKPLDLAIEMGHFKLISPLLEYGSETDHIMQNLQRSLKRDECLEELLKANFDINTKGCNSRTLLHNIVAEEPENVEFFEKLVNLGADVNCFDHRKNNLLHTMADSIYNRDVGLPLLMAILKKGVEVEALNLSEQTTLQLAIINGKEYMIQPLLEYGAVIANATYRYPTLFDEAYDRKKYGCLKEMMKHLIVQEIRGEFVEEKLKSKMASPLYIKFYTECWEEIQGLKLCKVPDTPLNYHDLIFNTKKVAKYLRNRRILEAFSETLVASSNFYCKIMKSWEEAKLRRCLEDAALERMPKVFYYLPYTCVSKILEKVDVEVLEKWIEYFSTD